MITSAVPDPCKVDSAAVVVVEVAEVRCCLVARETIPFALREGPQVRFAGAVPEIRELTKDTVSSWVRLSFQNRNIAMRAEVSSVLPRFRMISSHLVERLVPCLLPGMLPRNAIGQFLSSKCWERRVE